MSDAKVTFDSYDVDGNGEAGKEQLFEFACPKVNGRRCGYLLIAGKTDILHDPQGRNGGQAQWAWDGNRETPTFTPSIDCVGCWHGFIRNGRCVDGNDNDEPEP